MNPDTQRTSILLPSELYARLIAQAQEADRSLAAEIRQGLREYISRPSKSHRLADTSQEEAT